MLAVTSTSAGRLHAAALDNTNKIWNFKSWGCPFKLTAPILSDPADPPIQVDCGWGFTSCLTKSGTVYVWFPFGGPLKELIETKMSEFGEARASTAREENGSIPCVTWNTDFEPVRLPAIPILPDLPEVGQPNSDDDETDTHLVQIAGMDRVIIGLTNRGHVLKFQQVVDEISVSRGRWEYVSHLILQVARLTALLPAAPLLQRSQCSQRPCRLHAREWKTCSNTTPFFAEDHTCKSSSPEPILILTDV